MHCSLHDHESTKTKDFSTKYKEGFIGMQFCKNNTITLMLLH